MHALGFQNWYDSGTSENFADTTWLMVKTRQNMSPQQTPRVAWQAKKQSNEKQKPKQSRKSFTEHIIQLHYVKPLKISLSQNFLTSRLSTLSLGNPHTETFVLGNVFRERHHTK